jgi:hypothetical protein
MGAIEGDSRAHYPRMPAAKRVKSKIETLYIKVLKNRLVMLYENI